MSTSPELGSSTSDTSSDPSRDSSKSATSTAQDGSDRPVKRRAHKKSRAGCENCKIRRVKCDETRPKCHKCSSFGIECSYDSRSVGMQFAGESSFAIERPSKHIKPTENATMIFGPLAKAPGPMPSLRSLEDQFTPYKWMSADLDILAKFQERTVLTVGARKTADIYKTDVFKLAINYPFLTHVVITITLLHDRHLTGFSTIGERAAMHWVDGTTMFKEALMAPGEQPHRDALWATAAMLGCIQFASIEAHTPEEAWPLRPSQPDDLDWLKMSEGKKAVWKICNSGNSQSIFSGVRGHPDLYRALLFDGHELSNVTVEFMEVFGLGPTSNAEDNPYHNAAMCLARLLPIECNGHTILDFLSWMSQIHPRLKAMLAEKEPKALLLVACWYAKIHKFQWWIYRRGQLEGQAICIYLDRYYSHAHAIQKLLLYPKRVFGLAFADTEGSLLNPAVPLRTKSLAVTA